MAELVDLSSKNDVRRNVRRVDIECLTRLTQKLNRQRCQTRCQTAFDIKKYSTIKHLDTMSEMSDKNI